jgi:hypothetical protein
MDIKVIKLITGEELVAQAKEVDDGIFVKETAIIFSNSPGKLYLGSWLPYTDAPEGTVIPNYAVMLVLNPDKNMKEYYQNWANPKDTPAS